jgi:hypothetical protein
MKKILIKLAKYALNSMLKWYEKNDVENRCINIIKQVLLKIDFVLKDWATPTPIPLPEKPKKVE